MLKRSSDFTMGIFTKEAQSPPNILSLSALKPGDKIYMYTGFIQMVKQVSPLVTN